jgi:hypothetical protein
MGMGAEWLALIPTGIIGLLWYLLQQKDGRQQKEIEELSASIKRTADTVTTEREKAAALVMSEKEKLAALVKTEHDRLADQVRREQDRIREEFTQFRIKIAGEYATTTLVEKLLNPIFEKLNHIESMLPSKLDRREFEVHREEVSRGNGK